MRGTKPRDLNKFLYACDAYIHTSISQVEAAKIAGMSVPTFYKYINKLYTGEPLPKGLFSIPKVLIDYSDGYSIKVKADKCQIPSVVRVHSITKADESNMRFLTLTICASEINVKGLDGKITEAVEYKEGEGDS